MEQKYQSVFASLVGTIRAASGVAAHDIGFYRKLDKDLDKAATKTSSELLGLANDIMQAVVPGEVEELGTEESGSIDDHWRDVSHVLDILAERIDVALHQHTTGGRDEEQSESVKNPMKLSDGTNKSANSVGNNERVIKHQHNLAKPQEKFTRPVDNSPNKPFKPLLTSKPHSIQSFEASTELLYPAEDDRLTMPYYSQPYETEIKEQTYPKSVWISAEPQPSQPWATTEIIYVDTVEKLDSMIKQLSKAKEIAVDLEHHDTRSYYGFVCLMQISDRHNDFIVDTLVLRDELQALNAVFANPSILKVFHGASMDIIWLQRDFGLYIVSLFDTYHASRSLGLKRHGLAYLLEMYANFQTSKKYQLADWRIRPIPGEMMSYAQSDTHFLLNIYDQLRNELIRQGQEKKSTKLEDVLRESRLTALQRYEIPGYDKSAKQLQNPFAASWRSIAIKYNLSPSQQIVLEALYDWRDEVARKEDESQRYIMPNHLMVALSSSMPTDPQDLMGFFSTSGPRIRVHLKAILAVIKKAKVQVDALEAAGGVGEDDDDVRKSIETSGGYSDITSIDIDELEDNYEKYQAAFLKARTKQSMLFSQEPVHGGAKLGKPTSTFWGATVTESSVESVVKIEHLDGLSLSNGPIIEDVGSSDDEESMEELQVESAAVSDDKDLVYMGQSGVTHKMKEREDTEDTEMVEEPEVTLASFGGAKGPKRSKSKRNKKKSHSLAAAVAETSDSKKRVADSTNDDDESSPAKKLKGSESNAADSIPVAFDYTSAPSVLNREKEEAAEARKNKYNNKKKGSQGEKAEPFNPYGASNNSNGPRGAKKSKLPVGIGAGRSGTFKTKKK